MVKRRLWSVIWRVLVFFVGWAILSSPFSIPVLRKYAPNGGTLPLGLRVYIESVTVVSILVVAWLMLRFFDRRSFVSIGFTRRYAIRDSVVGLIIGAGMMTTCFAVMYFCDLAKPNPNAAFSGSALALATLAMIANTVPQEVMVRGYVQQTIQSQFGLLGGVISSALFFLALHYGAIQNAILPAISLFAAGILLGTCYAVSGNLWLPIGLHFGWNFLQGPVLGLTVSGAITRRWMASLSAYRSAACDRRQVRDRGRADCHRYHNLGDANRVSFILASPNPNVRIKGLTRRWSVERTPTGAFLRMGV